MEIVMAKIGHNNPPSTLDSVWTEAREVELRELWNKGMSAGKIAVKLGNNISKSAVIGKAHRLGLGEKTAANTKFKVNLTEDEINRSFDGCQWPFGDPQTEDFHYCGVKPVEIGKPYCKEHCAEAYTGKVQATKLLKE